MRRTCSGFRPSRLARFNLFFWLVAISCAPAGFALADGVDLEISPLSGAAPLLTVWSTTCTFTSPKFSWDTVIAHAWNSTEAYEIIENYPISGLSSGASYNHPFHLPEAGVWYCYSRCSGLQSIATFPFTSRWYMSSAQETVNVY